MPTHSKADCSGGLVYSGSVHNPTKQNAVPILFVGKGGIAPPNGFNPPVLFSRPTAWIIILGYRMQQSTLTPSHRTHIARFDANLITPYNSFRSYFYKFNLHNAKRLWSPLLFAFAQGALSPCVPIHRITLFGYSIHMNDFGPISGCILSFTTNLRYSVAPFCSSFHANNRHCWNG